MLNVSQQKTVVSGAPEGFDAKLIAELAARSDIPILHIARDDRRMAATQDAVKFFAPQCELLAFPAWDCPPYSPVSPNPNIASQRTSTLTELAQSTSSCNAKIVLTTVNAILQRVPSPAFMKEHSLRATIGRHLGMDKLRQFLQEAGYVPSPNVHGAGEYAIRGGILDVFPAGECQPIRLDFFGDQLDGIRRFDPETQMTINHESEIQIGLETEYLLNHDSISRFRQRFRTEFGSSQCDDRVYRSVSDGLMCPGLEHWLPFFHDRLDTLFEFLPTAIICIDDGVENLFCQRWKGLQDLFNEKSDPKHLGRDRSRMPPVLRPIFLYLSPEEFQTKLHHHQVKEFVTTPRPIGLHVINAGGTTGRVFAIRKPAKELPFIENIANHLKELRKLSPVCVMCWSNGSRARFSSMLNDAGLATTKISDFSEVNAKLRGIYLAVVGIEHGFVSKNLAVVSEQDVFGEKLVRKSRKHRSSAQLLAEASGFLPGELVVHEENGIGRYHGLKTIHAADIAYDCAEIEYAGGTRLFLPVVNIDLLTKYGSGEAKIDRLGVANWQERKARMKKNLLNIASELLQTAAARSTQTAPVVIPENPSWDTFLARFQFTETDDQALAIADVLSDLRKGMPMDRLICGDVGFGKTEIAMRAAFVTAMRGLQVAILAPTTLLVQQHFQTFCDRFAGFPLELRQLSRNTSHENATIVKQELKNGICDIVIGTHALFGKSITFNRLGLVIVDEEQNFGVEQKEKLKRFRANSHVLSMTATPIPRSLQMGLSGVRDLSIISTPPIDRLAIRTYFMEFDPITLRSAILHEFYRHGQCFVVVPRVIDLPEIIDFIGQYIPEVSFVVAHGQMPKTEMKSRVGAFYEGKHHVLLSTTIIASGIDIPTANTMIIVNADRFGLAQLYQIRGRVGRSGIRAYAYITHNPKTSLSEAARRRFEILEGLDTLGAGFSLAAQDLDMRGGGNLLGHEQSGHIREIGIELYQKMLAEAVASLKLDDHTDIDNAAVSPQINLRVPARIPETFIADLSVRLGLYRRMGNLTTLNEIEGYGAELIDRFGKLPQEVETLLQIVHIKLQCKSAGISKLDAGPKGATVEFHNHEFSNIDGLMEFIRQQKGSAAVRQNKLVLKRDWKNQQSRLRGAAKIAKHIAKIAVCK